MHCYETKIINRSGKVGLQVPENYLSDFNAVRAAQKLCGDAGDYIEIWHDNVYIYGERPRPRLDWPPPKDAAPWPLCRLFLPNAAG